LKSLQNLVKEMLIQKQDRISWEQAVEILKNSFEGYSPPEGISWLDVLIGNGLLQRWPVYQSDPDPLRPADEVVGFSFQRFQDHFMAKQLLENVTDPVSAFKVFGAAAFCLTGRWQWGGLISALSIIIPEKYEKELIDCLTEEQQQQLDYSIVEAFKESVRWRDKNAFTERTRKLLNELLR